MVRVNLRDRALALHRDNRGKIEVNGKVKITNLNDLALAYTPGVAEPCRDIHADPEKVYEYTGKGNAVAVVTNGSAALGLGNIGAGASLPVMEGKCVLFKSLAGVDAYPIALDTEDPEAIITAVKLISPGFGGINLEDIKAPHCFQIEETLKNELEIPVFHDDQHGTAIVVLAGLINAVKLVGKRLEDCYTVINGAGAAGLAVTRLLLSLGVKQIRVCDIEGVLYPGSPQNSYPMREEIAALTNPDGEQGLLNDVLAGADIFVGLSGAGVLDKRMVSRMAGDSIIMAMANPIPEIMPEEALKGGARIVFTGRSDFPNQVNNVSAFPGVFRGALDVRAREINQEMKIAAADAIAGLIPEHELSENNVIPSVMDHRVAPSIAKATAEKALETGAARISVDPEKVYANALKLSALPKE